ncbi:MAG: lytic transglycosylase domain-containing protein [Ectobacillus sp.]
MIQNIVKDVLSYKRAQFEEKINNPHVLAGSFQKQLQAAEETKNNFENVAGVSVQQNTAHDIKQAAAEIERRFGEQSISGKDRWNVLQKYNVQLINPKYRNMYIDIISEMSAKYGIPTSLIQKMIETESNFNSKAVSHAGARGLMQLMPANIKEHGVTDPYDARQNIEAGVQEISGYLKRYNGDLMLALAAYNAGPGNVKKYGGVPPFKETQNYIKKILNIDIQQA